MNYWGWDWPSALVLFTELKICVHNHAGYELLRPRSTINPADVASKRHPPQLAPVASATDWPHTKSWDISLDCHIGKYRGVIRSKIVFLESVTFQFHACMLSSESEVAQSLLIKSYGHFSDLGVGIALSHRHVGFFGWSKYIHPRPRRRWHGSLHNVLHIAIA